MRREDAAITIYYFRVLPSTDELLIPWQVFEFIFSSISQERRRQIFADFPAKHLHTIQNMKFLSFIILIPFPFHSLGNPLISPIFCIQLFNIVWVVAPPNPLGDMTSQGSGSEVYYRKTLPRHFGFLCDTILLQSHPEVPTY